MTARNVEPLHVGNLGEPTLCGRRHVVRVTRLRRWDNVPELVTTCPACKTAQDALRATMGPT